MGAAANTLADLAAAVARIEARGAGGRAGGLRMPLGPAEIDRALGGGLKRGALHAVTAASAAGAAAATGFAAALAGRAAGSGADEAAKGRAVLWIRQDFAARENGEVWGPGLVGIGLDPARLVVLRAPDAASALKAAEAGLACSAFAATVVEPFGALAGFGRVAGRRLALAAGRSGALGLMLRTAAPPQLPAGLLAAETRWRIAPLASSFFAAVGEASPPDVWGRPLARAELVRNRLGSLGGWPLAWGFDDGAFRLAERRFGALDAAFRANDGAASATDPRARTAGAPDRPDAPAGPSEAPVRRAG